MREAIHAVKYQTVRATAPILGRLLGRWIQATPVPGEFVVPVPLHKRRLRSRGYNQSELLAEELGKLSGLPVGEAVLVRTRDTPPQVSLSGREERVRNVEGSFSCVGEVEGRKILLVDDVVTTGSTLSACGSALRASGADSVWGVALARQ